MAHHHITKTDNLALNLLVIVWRDAFRDAEGGDTGARADIVQFFSLDALKRLKDCQCITWDPEKVYIQRAMF